MKTDLSGNKERQVGKAAERRESIELRRTPSAIEGDGGAVSAAKKKQLNRFVMLRDQIQDMLPTPKAQDGYKGNLKSSAERKAAGFFVDLPNVAIDLLPTTRTSMANGPTRKEIAEGNPKSRIETEVMLGETSWGKFGPAIERWETTTGRQAPKPTKPDGKDGNHRLSSKFTEWMMGLPDGWITGHGLKRNEELKLAGNGVVPQQAELALRILLEGIPLPTTSKQVNLPTPTVSDTFTDNLRSTQQKDGSMHSVTWPQAVKMIKGD
jgi:hypothetical protein